VYMKFRRIEGKTNNAYAVVKNFFLRRMKLAGGVNELALMRKATKDNRGGFVCPLTLVFDAIYSTHYRCAHGKVSPTHKLLQLTYWNITEREVKSFISLCPSCNKERPTIPPFKGALKPIRSGRFVVEQLGALYRLHPTRETTRRVEVCLELFLRCQKVEGVVLSQNMEYWGHGKGYLWIPVDRYKVLSDDMPIEEELSNLRDEIQNGHFMTKPKKTLRLLQRSDWNMKLQKGMMTLEDKRTLD
jgi:hypothetical protein